MSDPRHDGPPLTRREALARERAAGGPSLKTAAASAATGPAITPATRTSTETRASTPSTRASTVTSASAAPVPRTRAITPATRTATATAPATRALAPTTSADSTASTARVAAGPAPRLLGAPRPDAVLRRVREAAVPAFALLLATLFFSSNVTPASASDLGGSGIPVSTAAPMTGQTLAASLVVLAVADRDSYGVTDPPPPPPPEPEPAAVEQTVTGSSSSSAVVGGVGAVASGGGTIVNSGTGDIRWPFPGSVVLSSGFGPRSAPCAACSSMHMGLDMTPGGGTPIGAVAAGTVRIAGVHAQFGTYVVIDHMIDGGLVSTMYAHMRSGSSPLTVGQQVGVGELVGAVGRTGVATGEHLHFEVLMGGSTQIDPKAWLDANAGRTL